ncbi:phage GP46 family protein [Pseudomonas entomophila]|uniref:phage GP46 family protein n=1 Tax=Pseudomonas sp. RIT-PI-S TaxID=3035295 RepID=UPI0021D964DB
MITFDDQETSLRRAVEISWFTWRRAKPGDLLDDDERYGWWGDSFPLVANDRIGSRLWLLRRRKLLPETISAAITYAREALQWLLDDGQVLDVQILTERAGANRLNLGAVLTLPTGERLSLYPNENWQVLYAV